MRGTRPTRSGRSTRSGSVCLFFLYDQCHEKTAWEAPHKPRKLY